MGIASRFEGFESTVQRSFPLQVLLAVAVSLLALFIRLALNSLIGEMVIRYGTFYLAILIVARASGFYPAWFTVGLVAFADIALIQAGIYLPINTIESLIFIFISALLIALVESLRSALRRSEAQRRLLQQAEQQIRQALAEADQERRRLQTVLKALPVGVYISDSDGRFTEYNEVGVRAWAGHIETPVGVENYGEYKGWWSETGERIQADEWALARALRGETSLNEVIDIERFDGSRGTILNSAAPIFDAEGNIVGGVVALVDITAQREAERELRDSEARYRALWDASFDAKLIHDNGLVLAVNRGFTEMMGYTSEDLIGKNAIPIMASPGAQPIIEEHVHSQDELPYQVLLRRKDSSELWVEVRSKHIVLGSRHVRLASARDISAEREARQRATELEMEKARLHAVTTLIQNISHDFRTPLANIITSVYLLERLTESERRQEKVANINKQVERLIRLVDNMLMMTRLNSGAPPVREPVDLPLLLRMVVSKFEDAAQYKKVALTLQTDADYPTLNGDETQLDSLFRELVSNAIRHTDAGGVVRLRVARQADYTVVEVHDTGIGINPDDQSHIFEAFYRADQARGTDTGGIGLGLTIVHKIVELHAGRIEVDSEPGGGSIFRVLLPFLTLPAYSTS